MSTQNKYLDFKGLSYFYDNVIKKHDVFFYTYYKTHPEEIVNLPKEIIYKYFPDILMIIEPLNGSVVIYNIGSKSYTLLETTNGVIDVNSVKKAYDELEMDYPIGDEKYHINLYNCLAVKYCNLEKLDFNPGTTTFGITVKPENQLKLVEGLTGWKNLDPEQFNWFVEPNYWDNNRQLWWDEEKITFNGDWFLLNENMSKTIKGNTYIMLSYFMDIQKDRFLDRVVEFNGTMYIGNMALDYGQTVNIGWEWAGGLRRAFVNFKCYQYPTIDLTRYTESFNFDRNHYGVKKGQMLFRFIETAGTFNWTPERPQKCLIKGMGPLTYDNRISLNGIIDWDYDDMIASLITYAHNYKKDYIPGTMPNRYILSQTSYDKLTEDDLAAIVAMGNSVAVV